MSYILNLDGTVDKGESKKLDGKIIVQNMSPDSDDSDKVSSYLGTRRKDMTFGINEGGEKTISNAENTLVMDEAGDKKNYEYFRNFNTVFDEEENNSIFATELEIANGSSPFTALTAMIPGEEGSNALLKKLTISLDIMLQAITYIGIAEVILTLNNALQLGDSNEVEEKYHLKLGEYYLADYDAISTYIFKTLNYPKEKSGIISIDERIAAYLIGLSEFVNSDKLIDWGKISRLDKDNILGRKEREKYSLIPGSSNFDMSNVLWATIIYVFETVSSLSTTGMNRLYMLARKFENEKRWNSDNQLYKSKKKNKDDYYADGFDKALADMNYYYFKFVIERMHIGLKIIRRFQYNMMRDIKENGRNRVGLSKSGIKDTDDTIDFKAHERYLWKGLKSGSENSQSTRLRSLPQSFIMPHNFIKSMIINNQTGDNEFKISLGGDNSIAQNFAITKNKRLSAELVEKLETHLDKEYMPFYLHDTRTNEIISFHAFIETISDSFTQSTNPQSGFGRMDDVHHFVKATRSIRVSFVVVATSKEDYDLMWYQINKLVAMCYPQWSKGYKLDPDPDNDSSTEYPFSQVPTASPLVRMRLGDVIKSNYTKQNVSRLYGAENAMNINDPLTDNAKNKLIGNKITNLKNYLIPGIYKFTPPGFNPFSPTSSDRYINLKDYTEAIISKQKENYVEVEVENPETKKKIKIVADAYSIVEKNITHLSVNEANAQALKKVITNAKKVFFNTEDEGVINPIIASYESALGKGLAGFITNLSFDYFSNATWEIADESKAPKTVKIDISFAPIHDIPLGLDSDGMLRAPAYNVGEINNSLFGTVYKDHNEIKKTTQVEV